MDVAKASRHKHWPSLSALTAQTWKLAGGRWRASEACSGGASCLQPAPQARVAWSVVSSVNCRDCTPSSSWTPGILLLLQALQPGSKACCILPELWCWRNQLLAGTCQGRHHSADHPPAHCCMPDQAACKEWRGPLLLSRVPSSHPWTCRHAHLGHFGFDSIARADLTSASSASGLRFSSLA